MAKDYQYLTRSTPHRTLRRGADIQLRVSRPGRPVHGAWLHRGEERLHIGASRRLHKGPLGPPRHGPKRQDDLDEGEDPHAAHARGFDEGVRPEGEHETQRCCTYLRQSALSKAWGAIADLVGGEDKIEEYTTVWGDSFIVNLGTDEWEDKTIQPADLDKCVTRHHAQL